MKRTSKGAAIAQYGIVIALVTLGCFAAYSLLGKTLIDQLTSFLGVQNDINSNLTNNIEDPNANPTSKAVAGSLGGTTSVPQEDCTGGLCTVDYGDFILSGVPENYQDFIEAQGTSGGTDKLVSIVNQLADQLEADGDLAEAQELRDFANLLAFMGDTQANIESIASSCATSAAQNQCLESAMKAVTIDRPANLNTILPDFSSDSLYSKIRTQLDVGSGSWEVNVFKTWFDIGKEPNETIVQLYNDIKANPKFSDQIKNIITQTFSAANISSTNLSNKTQYLSISEDSDTPYIDVVNADPLTGVLSEPNFIRIENVPYNELLHPSAANNPTLNIP